MIVQSHPVNNAPLLLGHRGSRTSGYRENTMAAFEAALQHGCDGFEFDVRLSRDRHALICHNARSRGRLLARSDAAELHDLARLNDVISAFAARAFLDIELKEPGLEDVVLSSLANHPPRRGYMISSFLPRVLISLREQDKNVPLGLVFDRKSAGWRDLPVNYILPHKSLVTPDLIKQAHEASKMIMAWTVNDRRSMLRFAEWGIDGMISDKTELLVSTLRPQR